MPVKSDPLCSNLPDQIKYLNQFYKQLILLLVGLLNRNNISMRGNTNGFLIYKKIKKLFSNYSNNKKNIACNLTKTLPSCRPLLTLYDI